MARALAKTVDFKEAKEIRDWADAALDPWRAGLRPEVREKAAELTLRVERRAGELLAGLALHGGDRKSVRDRVTLARLGSHRQHISTLAA